MLKEEYWIWLTRVKNINRTKINILLKNFEYNIEKIWNSTENDLRNIRELKEGDIINLIQSKRYLEQYLQELNKKNIGYYSIQNENYPDLLKEIFDPPHVLYYKGNLEKLKNKSMIGIVGSRECSEYGKKIAYTLGNDLARQNVVIVSGMARGIDTYAHKGALDANGYTIAVLGNGVDICYPRENSEIMDKIIQTGAVISELPPQTQSLRMFFPMRNRIISGISKGTILVEAARKSGSLITADQALEQGRDIFAIPGNITSPLSEGTNYLIKQGAKLITGAKDVLDEINIPYNKSIERRENINTSEKNKKNQIPLEKEEIIVYDYIHFKPQNIEELLTKVEYKINFLQHILTLLELKGYIIQLPGKNFIRK